MERREFNKLLREAEFKSKKEFAKLINTSISTVGGWGISGKKIPNWVESWLKNFIKLKEYEQGKQCESSNGTTVEERLDRLERIVYG